MPKSHLRAMFPLRAKEMAFINSVVLGTRANTVMPKNFSSIPESLRTTSTTSTNNSKKKKRFENQLSLSSMAALPAISAYRNVHASKTLALVVRLQEGAS